MRMTNNNSYDFDFAGLINKHIDEHLCAQDIDYYAIVWDHQADAYLYRVDLVDKHGKATIKYITFQNMDIRSIIYCFQRAFKEEMMI